MFRSALHIAYRYHSKKKDQSTENALDSKILNEHPHENNYQMPNIVSLIQTIFQTQSNAKHETVFFYNNWFAKRLQPTKFTLLVNGKMTGTYPLKIGLNGIMDTPFQFRKLCDCSLIGLINTFCFLDEILGISRGKIEVHIKQVENCHKNIDGEWKWKNAVSQQQI